jgi:hypothetical protein
MVVGARGCGGKREGGKGFRRLGRCFIATEAK